MFVAYCFQDAPHSPGIIGFDDSKLDVQVLLDKNKQPHFKNLMSLASAGNNLIFDTEEEEEPLNRREPTEMRSSRSGKRGKKKKKQG